MSWLSDMDGMISQLVCFFDLFSHSHEASTCDVGVADLADKVDKLCDQIQRSRRVARGKSVDGIGDVGNERDGSVALF